MSGPGPFLIDNLSVLAENVVQGDGTPLTTALDERYAVDINPVLQFGVVGDGVTDDSTALIAMRDYMLATPTTHWVVRFPRGHYCYSNNRWIQGVRYLQVIAHGCQFECISTSARSVNGRLLRFSDAFDDSGDVEYTSGSDAQKAFGHKIASTAENAQSVTTLTAADAGNYAAGDWVLIHGYNQADSHYPPNLKYFDYAKVGSADDDTGVIVLDRYLRNIYNEDWWDSLSWQSTPNQAGAPRILSLNRTNLQYTETLLWEGGEFLNNRNQPTLGAFTPSSVIYATFRHIKAAAVTQTSFACCKSLSFIDAEIKKCEADKLVEDVTYNNVRVTESVGQGVGIDSWRFINCVFENARVYPGSRRVSFSNNVFRNTSQDPANRNAFVGSYLGAFSQDMVSFTGNYFEGARGSDAATPLKIFNTPNAYSLTIATLGAGNEIVVAKVDAAAYFYLARLDRGYVLYNGDLTKRGIFREVVEYDEDNIALVVDWWATPAVAETYYWNVNRYLHDGGGNSVRGVAAGFVEIAGLRSDSNRTKRVSLSTDRDKHAFRWSTANVFAGPFLVKSIFINVEKAYSGPDASPRLRVRRDIPTPAGQLLEVDLAVTGARYIDKFNAHNLQVNDTSDQTLFLTGVRELEINPRTGGTNALNGTDLQQAVVTIELEVIQIL